MTTSVDDPSAPASDAALLDRVAHGDRAAADALVEAHVDAVHDHLARWSRDAELAAAATVAAFTDLVRDVVAGRPVSGIRAGLLRRGRARLVERLRVAPGAQPLAPAVLAASQPETLTGAATTNARTAAAMWGAVATMDEDAFSAFDLTVRHGLDRAGVAAVLELDPVDVAGRLARMRRAAAQLPAPSKAYAALAPVRAPQPVRGAIAHQLDDAVGPALVPGRRRTALAALGVLGLLTLAGAAIAGVMVDADDVPLAGPATAAAVPVEDPTVLAAPSPEATPSPAATLEALPTVDPTPPPVAPQPTPSPDPTVEPSPTPDPLVVAVDRPAAGATFDATEEDAAGRPAARVPVAATVSGGAGGTAVTWTSSRAPDDILLASSDGTLLLWLQEACLDTPHTLTVTATDGDGATASATVDVVALETCVEPLVVDITSPADGAALTATRDGERHRVTFDVAAEASEADVRWAWRSDRVPGEVILDAGAGTVSIPIDDCTDTTLTVFVEVERPSDATTATDSVQLTVACVG